MTFFCPYTVDLVDETAYTAQTRDIYERLASALGEKIDTIIARAEAPRDPEPVAPMCLCERDVVITSSGLCEHCFTDRNEEEDNDLGADWLKDDERGWR